MWHSHFLLIWTSHINLKKLFCMWGHSYIRTQTSYEFSSMNQIVFNTATLRIQLCGFPFRCFQDSASHNTYTINEAGYFSCWLTKQFKATTQFSMLSIILNLFSTHVLTFLPWLLILSLDWEKEAGWIARVHINTNPRALWLLKRLSGWKEEQALCQCMHKCCHM